MKEKSISFSALAALVGLLLSISACQSTAKPKPALITKVDMAALTEALATATGQVNIFIVPAIPVGAKSLSVPPPRLNQFETRSPSLPRQFLVVEHAGTCVLLDEIDGKYYAVDGLLCQPVEE